ERPRVQRIYRLNPAAAARTATPLSTPNFPSLSGPSRAFVYDHALTAFVDDDTKTSTWSATGTLNGNSLTVQYNERMKGADFEDAGYVLAHGRLLATPTRLGFILIAPPPDGR